MDTRVRPNVHRNNRYTLFRKIYKWVLIVYPLKRISVYEVNILLRLSPLDHIIILGLGVVMGMESIPY